MKNFIRKCTAFILAGTLLFSSVFVHAESVPPTEKAKAVSQKQIVASSVSNRAYNGFEYQDKYGYITITKYTGTATALKIPATIAGKRVEEIGPNAFAKNTRIKSVSFGAYVRAIFTGAFYGCTALTTLVLPDTITYLGEGQTLDKIGIFEGCTSLQTVTLSNNLEKISTRAFANCKSLKTVKFGKNLKDIHPEAFLNCTSLAKINFSDTLSSISENAFANCSSLKTALLGNGVRLIGKKAFYNCKSLQSIVLPDSVTDLGYSGTSRQRYQYDSKSTSSAFENCINLKSVKIGKGVRRIPRRTFYGCSSLLSVGLGNTDTIGEYAFAECKSLKQVVFPASLLVVGDYSFYGNRSLQNVNFGQKLNSIGGYAFSNCSSLSSVNLPNSVKEIGTEAFRYCTSLRSLRTGTGLADIRNSAFANCASLTDVVFGESKKVTLYHSAFYNCTNLAQVKVIGKNRPGVNRWVFSGTKFKDFTYLSSSATKTVTINANGGSGGSYKFNTVKGEKIPPPEIPVRSGYVFSGFYTNAAGTGTAWNFSTKTVSANITLYAKWKPKVIRLYFDPNGGAVNVGHIDLAYGKKIGNMPVPKKSGDTFLGWRTGVGDGGGKFTSSTYVPPVDLILEAHWKKGGKTTNTVFFFTGPAKQIPPLTVKIGYGIGALPTPSPVPGHKFLGWYKDSNFQEKFTIHDRFIYERYFKLYARFVPDTPAAITVSKKPAKLSYTVGEPFSANGMEVHAAFADGRNIKVSSYTVSGFSSASAGKKTITVSYQGLSAKFEVNVLSGYSVNYVTNGGSAIIRKSYTSSTASFKLPTPTRKGYHFAGWYDNSKLTGKQYTQITKGSKGNKTFYAKWTLASYAVTYVANGGNAIPKKGYTVNTLTFKLPTPTCKGYAFVGWYTNSKFTGTKVTQLDKGSVGNRTFYAKWKITPYTVSYVVNGGKAIAKKSYTISTATFRLPTPTRSGYRFDGWYGNSKLTGSKMTQIAKGNSGNKTVYAKWSKIRKIIAADFVGDWVFDLEKFTEVNKISPFLAYGSLFRLGSPKMTIKEDGNIAYYYGPVNVKGSGKMVGNKLHTANPSQSMKVVWSRQGKHMIGRDRQYTVIWKRK